MLLMFLACAPEVTVGSSERSTPVLSPSDWDGQEALPVVFLLHGLGSTAGRQDWYMGFSDQVDTYRFHLLLPLGYRADEGDWLAPMAKVRKAKADMVTELD